MSNLAKEHLSFDSEHRLRAENLPFDIDVWYPLVKPYTFKSEFLPLLKTECKAIQAFYNVSYRHTRPHLTQVEISSLQNLEKAVDALFAEHFPRHKGAFVRLCGRSPKDGEPLDRSQVYRDYECNLARLLEEGQEMTMHTKMTAIARTSWLKVHSGAEVMALLLSSERVYADMLDWDRFGEPEQICLRDWDPNITMDYEFRVFVNAHNMTAISQYDHYAYYPHLEAQRDKIELAIRSLWKDVHPLLGLASYCLDVAYVPLTGRCVMIELSPFLACTGPALFSWSVATDLLVLEGGDGGKFEFRLKEESCLHPQLDELLEINWNDRWNRPQGEESSRRYDDYFVTSAEDHAAASGKSESHGQICALQSYRCISGALAMAVVVAIVKSGYNSEKLPFSRLKSAPPVCVVVSSSMFLAVTALYFRSLSSRASWAKGNETSRSTSNSSGPSPHVENHCCVRGMTAAIPQNITLKSTETKETKRIAAVQEKVNTESVTETVNEDSDEQTIYLFVYGTLKRGFHWNQKYLHERRHTSNHTTVGTEATQHCFARFVSRAVTSHQHLLFVGDCGVPYLSLLPAAKTTTSPLTSPSGYQCEQQYGGDKGGGHVVGELWAVSPECLQSLDDYEGVSKGYYQRTLIPVHPDNAFSLPTANKKTGEKQRKKPQERASGRERIGMEGKEERVVMAHVYHLATLPEDLMKTATLVPSTNVKRRGKEKAWDDEDDDDDDGEEEWTVVEYSLAMHQSLYRPIRHIRVKQLGYLSQKGVTCSYSTWGHCLQPAERVDEEAVTCVLRE